MQEGQGSYHELLIRIDERIKEVLRRLDGQDTKLDTLERKFDKEIINLSRRVTVLENFRWYLLGAAMATGVAAKILMDALYR